MERALLRNGNVHSADDWQSVLEPVIARYRGYEMLRFFRGDAGFADPDVYRCLEAEGYSHVIRLKGNQILYTEETDYPVSQLSLSGSQLEDRSKSRRKSGVACGRTVSENWLHRDKSPMEIQQRGSILQQAWHC